MSVIFRERELIVYVKEKHGTHPGPRAQAIRPAPAGDTYDYVVRKYWLVENASIDGRLTLKTPGGKRHQVQRDDPCLRSPTWLERLWLRLCQRKRLRALRDPQV
jgi:hypothetical protein